MENNLCFLLNKKKIYMDMCLIEDEIPIFFSCTDTGGSYYVALCTDMDLPAYCVVETALTQLRDMLCGKIQMRDIFTGQSYCWQVVSTDGNAVNDIVTYMPVNQLDSEDLPLEDSYFCLFNEELKEYVSRINKKIVEGRYDSFPMLTNEAFSDINDGKEINVQVKYKSIPVSAKTYSAAIKLEYVATIKTTGKFKIKYDKEENCIITKEKKSVEDGDMTAGKFFIDNPADKKILLLAA